MGADAATLEKPQQDDIPLTMPALLKVLVHLAEEDFPQLKGKFGVVDMTCKKLIGNVDPRAAGFESQDDMLGFVSEAMRETADFIRQHGPNSSLRAYKDFKVILFGSDSGDQQNVTEARLRQVMNTFFHELGHLIVPFANDAGTNCYAECAADAFAMIQHLRRTPDDIAAVNSESWMRARDYVFRGAAPTHVTSFTLEKLAEMAYDVDFSKVTPQQAILLAGRLAAETTPTEQSLAVMQAAYRPAQEILRNGGSSAAAVERLAQSLLLTDSTECFRMGYVFLKPMIEGKIGQLPQTASWQKTVRALEAKDADIRSNGLMQGLPRLHDDAVVFPFPRPAAAPKAAAALKTRH